MKPLRLLTPRFPILYVIPLRSRNFVKAENGSSQIAGPGMVWDGSRLIANRFSCEA